MASRGGGRLLVGGRRPSPRRAARQRARTGRPQHPAHQEPPAAARRRPPADRPSSRHRGLLRCPAGVGDRVRGRAPPTRRRGPDLRRLQRQRPAGRMAVRAAPVARRARSTPADRNRRPDARHLAAAHRRLTASPRLPGGPHRRHDPTPCGALLPAHRVGRPPLRPDPGVLPARLRRHGGLRQCGGPLRLGDRYTRATRRLHGHRHGRHRDDPPQPRRPTPISGTRQQTGRHQQSRHRRPDGGHEHATRAGDGPAHPARPRRPTACEPEEAAPSPQYRGNGPRPAAEPAAAAGGKAQAASGRPACRPAAIPSTSSNGKASSSS